MSYDITNTSAIYTKWPPPPIISEWELKIIDKIILDHPRRKIFLEIGGFRGGSAYHFAQLMEAGATIITVDLPEGIGGGNTSPRGMAETLADQKRVFQELREQGFNAHLILGDSRNQTIINKVYQIIGNQKLDVLFIDGDHSIIGASNDFYNYRKNLEGLAIFHDCGGHWGTAEFKPDSYAYMMTTRGVFHAIATGRRSLVIQEDYGTGIIWYD